MPLALLLLLPSADAEPLYVAGARVAAGVATDGSLCDSTLELCLRWDPPGDAPMGDDLLWPGWAYEIWAAEWTGPGGATTLENGAPYTGSDLSPTWTYASGPDVDVLVGVASTPDADWELRVEAPWSGDVVWLTLTLTARARLADIHVARIVDVDADWAWTQSYATDNTVGEGWVASAGLWDGRAVVLAAPGGEARMCSACTTVEGLLAGTTTETEADVQIGVDVAVGTLEVGERAKVRFAYGFAMDVADAVDLAVGAAADDDHDDDGVGAPDDCDDADADVFPGAVETTDGRDEDCDGSVDEESAGVDDDGDGWAEVDGDCDDASADVYPGADPVDGVADADCDGEAEGIPDDGAGDEDTDDPDAAIVDDGIEVEGGCSTSGGSKGAALAFAALLVAAARRDRRAA